MESIASLAFTIYPYSFAADRASFLAELSANAIGVHELQTEEIRYRLEWSRNEEGIRRACRSDGLFPLVDNTALEPLAVLRAYKDQPYLEKRFSTKKSVLEVAPVFLERP